MADSGAGAALPDRPRPPSAASDAGLDADALAKLREYIASLGAELPAGWRAEARTRAGGCSLAPGGCLPGARLCAPPPPPLPPPLPIATRLLLLRPALALACPAPPGCARGRAARLPPSRSQGRRLLPPPGRRPAGGNTAGTKDIYYFSPQVRGPAAMQPCSPAPPLPPLPPAALQAPALPAPPA
jgi:hypothetical protein